MINRLIILLMVIVLISSLKAQDQQTKINFTQEIERIKTKIPKNYQIGIQELNELKKKAVSAKNEEASFRISYELALIYMNVSSDFDKVVVQTKEMEAYAHKIKDYFLLGEVYQMRGVSYLSLNFLDQGFQDLKQSLQYLDKAPISNKVYLKKAIVYNNISDYYAHSSNNAKELEYKKKSYAYTNKMEDSDSTTYRDKKLMQAFINVQLGGLYENKKMIDSAEFYYQKSKSLFDKYGNEFTLYGKLSVLKGLSSVNLLKKNYQVAIDYSKQALDQHDNQLQSDFLKKVYLILQKSYMELNEVDSANKYFDLYVAENTLNSKNDLTKQNKAVNNLIEEKDLENNRDFNYYMKLFLVFIVIAFGVLYLYFDNYSKKQKTKYLELMMRLENSNENSTQEDEDDQPREINLESTSTIHNETLYQLLNGLKKFEKSKKYLKNSISLPQLASELNTNTKYLSKIINEYKGKNFNQYINSLRIEYIIQELYQDPQLRKFKVAALAEKSGFSSREVFASTFKKETGVTPSYFIRQLEEN